MVHQADPCLAVSPADIRHEVKLWITGSSLLSLPHFFQRIAVKDGNLECSECGRLGTVHVGVNENEKFELTINEVNKMKEETFLLFITATGETILYSTEPKRGAPYVNPLQVWV